MGEAPDEDAGDQAEEEEEEEEEEAEDDSNGNAGMPTEEALSFMQRPAAPAPRARQVPLDAPACELWWGWLAGVYSACDTCLGIFWPMCCGWTNPPLNACWVHSVLVCWIA